MLRRMVCEPEGRLRLGLRLFLYLVGFVAAVIAGEVSRAFLANVLPGAGGAVGGLVAIALTLALTRAARRHLDKRPWAGVGLTPLPAGLRHLMLGLAVAATFISLLFLLERALGWVYVVDHAALKHGPAAALGIMFGFLVYFLGVGFVEEVVFRGYLLQNAAERWPLLAASIGVGLAFGIFHFSAGGFGVRFVVSAIVLTLLLTALRLRTRSLWAPIGWHAGWDWAQDTVFALSRAGEPLRGETLVQIGQRGPEWLTGKAPSIEGGLLPVVFEVASLVVLLLVLPKAPIVWMGRLDPEGRPAAEGRLAA